MTTDNRLLQLDNIRLYFTVAVPPALKGVLSLKQAQKQVLSYLEIHGMKGAIVKGCAGVYADGNASAVMNATGQWVEWSNSSDCPWGPKVSVVLCTPPIFDDNSVAQLITNVEMQESTELIKSLNTRLYNEYRLAEKQKQEALAQEKLERENAEVAELRARLDKATTDEERESIRVDAMLLKLKRDIDKAGGPEAFATRLADMERGY